MKKICKTCGKEFEPEHYMSAYCSLDCNANRILKIKPCQSCSDVPGAECPCGKRKHIGGFRCSCCKKVYTTDSFQHNKSRADGLTAYCKDCITIKEKEKEKQERKKKGIKIIRPHRGPYQRKTNQPYDKESAKLVDGDRATLRRYYAYRNQVNRKKNKAKKTFNLPFSLFLSLTSCVCFYCGQFSPNKNHCGIDRIDSSIGYEPTNCVPCCYVCNRMKTDHSQLFFLSHAKKICQHTEKKELSNQPEQLLLPFN